MLKYFAASLILVAFSSSFVVSQEGGKLLSENVEFSDESEGLKAAEQALRDYADKIQLLPKCVATYARGQTSCFRNERRTLKKYDNIFLTAYDQRAESKVENRPFKYIAFLSQMTFDSDNRSAKLWDQHLYVGDFRHRRWGLANKYDGVQTVDKDGKLPNGELGREIIKDIDFSIVPIVDYGMFGGSMANRDFLSKFFPEESRKLELVLASKTDNIIKGVWKWEGRPSVLLTITFDRSVDYMPTNCSWKKWRGDIPQSLAGPAHSTTDTLWKKVSVDDSSECWLPIRFFIDSDTSEDQDELLIYARWKFSNEPIGIPSKTDADWRESIRTEFDEEFDTPFESFVESVRKVYNLAIDE